MSVGWNSPRYIQWPVWVEHGQDVWVQMVGEPEASYDFELRIGAEPGPWIVEQPVGASVEEGGSMVLHGVASGALLTHPVSTDSPELMLGARSQWYRNGVAVEGAQTPVLFLPHVDGNTDGDYQWVVCDDFGSSTSRVAQVIRRSSAQEVLPRLAIQPGEKGLGPVFTLTGETGAWYELEHSADLTQWTPADVQPNASVETEWEELPIHLAPRGIQSMVAVHGAPFRFQLGGLQRAAYVRARRFQSSCEVCMNQLRAVQIAKVDWGRTQRKQATEPVSETDIVPKFIALQWLTQVQTDPIFCPAQRIILGTLGTDSS